MANLDHAHALLHEFKGDTYLYGLGVLPKVGRRVTALGKRAALVRGTFPGIETYIALIQDSLAASGVELLGEIPGARPNAPRQDLYRITDQLRSLNPDVIVSCGGGSTIDAVKAAEVLRTLTGDIDNYFGTGLVTQALAQSGKKLTPHVAIQTAASSAAHLTKYSNITDLATGQKKLIVDDAIVPEQPVFDYTVTFDVPISLTADGAMDGFSHSLEVLFGSVGKSSYTQIETVAREGISLIVEYLPKVIENTRFAEGREALGLATDLGGYSIMLGGTNGAHLTSFSLVDVLSHGRACAIMNPYYMVFFAPAVEKPLKLVGNIFKHAGYTNSNIDALKGRELGMAVAEAMITFETRIGFPANLSQVPGFTDAHIERALTAAKDPQLKMKLENMPVAMTVEMVDEYMGPILQAAKTGELQIIKNVR